MMSGNNRPTIDRVLILVRDGIRTPLIALWTAIYGDSWMEEIKRRLDQDRNLEDTDPWFLLRGITVTFRDLEANRIHSEVRNLAFSIVTVRNDFAHHSPIDNNRTLKLITDGVELLKQFGSVDQLAEMVGIQNQYISEVHQTPLRRNESSEGNDSETETTDTDRKEEVVFGAGANKWRKGVLSGGIAVASAVMVLFLGWVMWDNCTDCEELTPPMWATRVLGHSSGDTLMVEDFPLDEDVAAAGEGLYALAAEAASVQSSGDIIVELQYEVKLLGVSAPLPGTCYAAESQQLLSALVPVGSQIELEGGRGSLFAPRQDAYVRLNGVLINIELARHGGVTLNRDETDQTYFGEIGLAEQSAREQRRGLWGACFPETTPASTSSVTTSSTTTTTFPPLGPGEWRVFGYVKGDDLQVDNGTQIERVRLIGIEAPHSGECFHLDSRDILSRIIPRNSVVRLEQDVSDRDQYDRLLRYVFIDDQLVNEEAVRQGGATASPYLYDTKYSERIEAAQTQAQQDQVGLWDVNNCGTVPNIGGLSSDLSSPEDLPAGGETFPSLSLGPDPASFPAAKVLDITDGDDLDVELEDGSLAEIRLLGINAPEIGECYADRSLELLIELTGFGSTVSLEADRTDQDQYGRLLRYVWVEETVVNVEMVRQGAALSRQSAPDDRYLEELETAQEHAVEDQNGLWGPTACGEASDATIVVEEIVYNPPGNETNALNEEWVRFINNGEETADLSGWTIADESASNRFAFSPGTSLEPGESITVHSGCPPSTPPDELLHDYWCSRYAIWNNDGDTVILRDANGNTHTNYTYP